MFFPVAFLDNPKTCVKSDFVAACWVVLEEAWSAFIVSSDF